MADISPVMHRVIGIGGLFFPPRPGEISAMPERDVNRKGGLLRWCQIRGSARRLASGFRRPAEDRPTHIAADVAR